MTSGCGRGPRYSSVPMIADSWGEPVRRWPAAAVAALAVLLAAGCGTPADLTDGWPALAGGPDSRPRHLALAERLVRGLALVPVRRDRGGSGEPGRHQPYGQPGRGAARRLGAAAGLLQPQGQQGRREHDGRRRLHGPAP